MLLKEKILITLNNDIGFTGLYADVADYICIKQSDKSGICILVAKESVKSAINLKGDDVMFDVSDANLVFTLFKEKEHIIKLGDEVAYAGVDGICNSDKMNEFLKGAKLLCINQALKLFVIIPVVEIMKEWEYE